MRWALVVVGVAVAATGVVWIFQGVGSLHGSFMTGEPFWLWMGVVAVLIGLPVAAVGLRNRRDR